MPGAPMRLGELASRLGRPVEGDADFEVRGAAALESAGPADLCFVASARYADLLDKSGAGAAILPPDVERGSRPAIRSPRPRLDFARALRVLMPEPTAEPGVHPDASVAPDARIDPTASVGARAVVGARSRVGPRSVLQPNATLYEDVEIGADCRIHAGVVLREGTLLGDRVILQPGVVIGGDGFGYEPGGERHFEKVPQVGRVVIEDDVEIGANTTVDRATLGETRIGSGVKIDNLVMIAHNCDIGSDSAVIAQSGIAGSTRLGPRAVLMAQSGVAGHLEIGSDLFLDVRGGVSKNLPDGSRFGGRFPNLELRAGQRVQAALIRLPQLLRRIRALERRLGIGERKREPDAGDEA